MCHLVVWGNGLIHGSLMKNVNSWSRWLRGQRLSETQLASPDSWTEKHVSHGPGVDCAEGHWTRVPRVGPSAGVPPVGVMPPHLGITESRTRGENCPAKSPCRAIKDVPQGQTTGICNLPQPEITVPANQYQPREDQALIPYFLSCSLSSPSQPKPGRTTISIYLVGKEEEEKQKPTGVPTTMFMNYRSQCGGGKTFKTGWV